MSALPACPRCWAAVAPEDPACPHCGADTSRAPAPPGASAADAPPDLPARYEVKVLLGWGGMGRVFLCRDSMLEVDVAVKVLRPDIAADERKILKIENEARVAARLRGLPGILGLYGFERHGSTRYLVMEYAAGGSVFQRLRDQGKIPEAGCRRLGAEIADALAAAHERGVLHRDIKPANILLDIAGRTKVADFGLAHLVSSAYGEASQTPLEGTPVYIPPEAFLRRGVDGRSDLYSLGVVLYEMATGVPPFKGSVREIAAAKTESGAAAPDPCALQPNLSPEFSVVVRRLMDGDPAQRFHDAASTAAALRGKENLLRMAGRDRGDLPSSGPESSSRGRRVPAPAGGRPTWVRWVAGIGLTAAAAAGIALALRQPGVNRQASSSMPAPPPAAVKPPVPGIFVVTKPAGAEVFVDGRPVGRTAADGGLRLTDIEPGVPHAVSALLEDHEPDEERGVVWKRGENRAPVTLKLVPRKGVVEMDGGRPGSRVAFRRDGALEREATFREDGTLAPEILPSGNYELEVVAPGFHPWKQTVKVSSGRNPRILVAMAEKDGFLAVTSVPEGARVLVDGSEVGKTPLANLAVAPGQHRILLEREKFAPESRDVEILGERTTDLGTVVLGAMATMDLATLPEGVTAYVDDAEVKGALRRSPGPVTVMFRKAGNQPQSAMIDLAAGPNSLPKLGEWDPVPGSLDFRGLGDSVDCVLVESAFLRPPWKVHSARPGHYKVVYARSGRTPVTLRTQVRSGETVMVPTPAFGAPAEVKTLRVYRDLDYSTSAGINWLLRHQDPQGYWSCGEFRKRCQGNSCGAPGAPYYDVGVTGLSILAVLGRRAVDGQCDGLAALRGIEWLVGAQVREGEYEGCYGYPSSNHYLYDHAIATLAVIEACRVTASPALLVSASKAVRFIEKCRNPGLGWRYGVRSGDNDTSVTVWMVQALREGADVGLDVDPDAFLGALAWLDQVTEAEYGRTGYTKQGNGPARPEELMDKFPSDKSEALTAAAIVARRACGRGPDDPYVQMGLDLCRKLPPTWDEVSGTIDFYYWYLGTRALFGAQASKPAKTDAAWMGWFEALELALVRTQRLDRSDCRFGSWDDLDPWVSEGGHVYSTAINVLTLEVPFRRAPEFREAPEATTISVASDPPGALAFLGGWFVGTTPIVKLPASAGAFSVRLEHPERADYSAEVTIPPFRDVDLGTILLPPGATLDLTDLPRDATVVMLGKESKGKVPVRPGSVEGTIVRSGHLSQRFHVESRAGETTKPEIGAWKPSREWPRALITGIPAPVPANLEHVVLPPGVVACEGRLWCEKDRVEMVVVPEMPATPNSPAAPAFLVDRHEVSVIQFQTFCKATDQRMPDQPGGSSNRHPVVRVAPAHALEYARWAGKRLLTLEEWQRAAVGHPIRDTPPPWPYPWGPWNSPRAHNSAGAEDGSAGCATVGSYPLGVSRCGALDLIGNVAERITGGFVTGNSYAMPRQEAYRAWKLATPELDVGFRCAMDLPAK